MDKANNIPRNDDATTHTFHSAQSSTYTLTALPEPEKEKGNPNVSVSSVDLAKAEKQPWEGYLDDELPDKGEAKYVRNFRHQLFTIYHRIFGVVFIVNMSIFIVYCVRDATIPRLGVTTTANLFTCILMRQDYVINAFFAVFCHTIPLSWPLWTRQLFSRVYHLGGIHSGTGVSGTIWLILFAAKSTYEKTRGHTQESLVFLRNLFTESPDSTILQVSIATIVIMYTILLLLLLMIIFAYPTFRQKFHNSFERVHRFMGWTAAALLWVLSVLITNDYKPKEQSLAYALKVSSSFWLTVILTASIILPWLRLRKVPVQCEVLSDHALRIFIDSTANAMPGSFMRISLSPLWEWHSFATIREPGRTGYSLIISQAGDWTTNIIQNPPEKLWIRGIPVCGVVHIVPMFRRVLLVATGSGIAPLIPQILAKTTELRLLWTSPNVLKTFGAKLVDEVMAKAPNAVIYDTRIHGRPDMVKLTHRMVDEFKPEAVVVISNEPLTRKIVYGMMSRGVLAFGAIWDS
ncbi:hypothetical protein E1B28_007226 [Marasmius oreades]|uniref:Nonribosomal peptide synthetase 12 n=1 Tax=Marasmius oreades TaxID=181124 RepID=A0A9P7UUP9_9AGAR|nr:uncharacterized protein E1B28_007226 [Marasmius oreades]KAG7093556.1 hypothetical protein E1B28_007226 [Marasmius oreades]